MTVPGNLFRASASLTNRETGANSMEGTGPEAVVPSDDDGAAAADAVVAGGGGAGCPHEATAATVSSTAATAPNRAGRNSDTVTR